MTKDEILKFILEKPKRLSPEQTKAVTSQKKYLRIIAGAGAGKTETMTRRIVYLLLYKDIAPKEIVAFTFTERAAQSIKDRIYKRVENLQGNDACAPLGEMFVGTIHAYCFRVLQDYFGYGDYEVLDDNQEMAFVMREGWSLDLGKGNYSKNCQTFIQSVNVVYDELIEKSDLRKKSDLFAQQFEDYENELKQHRLFTFGQLTALTVEKLQKAPQVLSHVKYLIVDEYQDINRAQERLIKLLRKNTSVFVVGDPRQTIYQWRGSDPNCFKRFDAEESITIPENRRSTRKIVDMANRFAETFEGAQYDQMSKVRDENGVFALVRCQTNASEAEWVTRQIKTLVQQKGLCGYSNIAILLRSVSTSAEPFLDVFKRENIPYLVGGKVGLFRRDEAQAVGRIFAWMGDKFWVEDPYKWGSRIEGDHLLTSAIAYWKSTLNLGSEPKRLRDSLTALKESAQAGRYKNFTSIYHDLLFTLGFLHFDQNDKLQAAIMANLGRFNELLSDYESSIRRGGTKLNWKRDLQGLCWYMNAYATGAYEEQPSDDIRGTPALQIMTVHQAKGLEWPIIFLPCVVDGRFPSRNAGSKKKWFVPEEFFDVRRYEGSVEDEKRLFYVAVTRTMDALTISRFERMKNTKKPSFFWHTLLNLQNETDETVDLPIQQIAKPPEDDEIQSYSAGEIINYLKCPYHYRLREVWGYQPGLVPELGYGKSLHFCLRCASDKIREGMMLERAVREAVTEKFHMPYADFGRKQRLQKAAERCLLDYAKKHEQDMHHIEEVESRLEFPLENATIVGRIDVILKQGKNPYLEVRDYKTSDAATTAEESALQVRLYASGLKRLGRPIGGASIAHLESGETKEVNINDRDLEEATREATESIKGIQSGCFDAKVGDDCSKDRCDYARICKYTSPENRAAA